MQHTSAAAAVVAVAAAAVAAVQKSAAAAAATTEAATAAAAAKISREQSLCCHFGPDSSLRPVFSSFSSFIKAPFYFCQFLHQLLHAQNLGRVKEKEKKKSLPSPPEQENRLKRQKVLETSQKSPKHHDYYIKFAIWQTRSFFPPAGL